MLSQYANRLATDQRGNFLLEFALALPILFLLVVGLVDLGRYSLQKSALLQGAREGAQYGIVAPADTANIQATAQNATGLTGVTATASTFCECVSGTSVSCASTCSGGGTPKKYVLVTTTRAFDSILGSATTAFWAPGNKAMSWTMPTDLSASVTLIVP
jgi:Flp pilus assembly protein TadG